MYRLLTIAIIATIIPAAASAKPGKASIKQVEITNFPDPQNVTGVVEVLNLPAVQDVEVLNLPAVQDVNVLSAPPAAACASRFELVGFTSATPSCASGLFPLTQACQSEFGGAARMCSSVEVIETSSIPSGLAGTAMVIPVIQTLGTGTTAVDASMVLSDIVHFNCLSWSNLWNTKLKFR